MGRGGFEPPKQDAADLQSVPFGHSGICPYEGFLLTRLEYSIPSSNLQVPFLFFYVRNGNLTCVGNGFPGHIFKHRNTQTAPFSLAIRAVLSVQLSATTKIVSHSFG